jgi:hypothetical protein
MDLVLLGKSRENPWVFPVFHINMEASCRFSQQKTINQVISPFFSAKIGGFYRGHPATHS